MADNTQINDFFDLAAFAEQAQIIVNESAKTAKLMREQFAEVGKGLNADGLQKYAAAAEKLQQTQKAAKQVLSDYEKAQERLTKSQGDYNRDLERLDELLKAEAQSTAAMAAQNKALEQIRKNLNTTDKDYASTVQKIIDKQNANIKVMKEFQNVEQKRTSGIGKYKEAIEEAMNATGGYRQQLANIKNTMADLEQTIIATKQAHGGESAEVKELQGQYEKLQKRAAQLQDAQNDMQARIRYMADDYANFNAAMEGMKGITAFGQGIAGVTSLLGVNSKAVERSIQVMMSLQSIMNAINTIQHIFNKDSRLMVALQNLKINATKRETVAMERLTEATLAKAAADKAASAATQTSTKAITGAASSASSALGVIGIGITAVITAYTLLSSAMDDATEATNENSDAVNKNSGEVDDNTGSVDENTEAWKNNAEARREALKSLSGGLLSNIENKGLSTLEREAALLEFVRGKLGQQVTSIEEARKVYNDFMKSVGGMTTEMDVFYSKTTSSGWKYYTSEKWKYVDLRKAALSLANAQDAYNEAKEKAGKLTEKSSKAEKEEADRDLQTWEARLTYAQNMYDILEQRTVGYYKNLKDSNKETKKTAESLEKTTEMATEAQMKALENFTTFSEAVADLQQKFLTGEISLKNYEGALAYLTFRAKEQELNDMIAALEKQNETLDKNSAEYVKNQQEIAKLQKQVKDLNFDQFKKMREELEKTAEAAKKTNASIFVNLNDQMKMMMAAAKFGLKQLAETTQKVMESVNEIGSEITASVEALSESIFESQTARLSREQDEMAQHYELQRAYIEANVQDEEERQQKLAQLALDEANAKAIAARKEAEVERRKAKVDLAITTAKASADVAAAIAAAVLAASAGDPYTLAVRIAAAVAAVLSAGAAVASAAAKINSIPAFERGGEAKRGLVFRAGERGYEVGQGVSGRTYLFPRDGVYVAPEPIRIHPHSESVQMVNNYNKAVTLRNSLTVKVIDNKRIEKYFAI